MQRAGSILISLGIVALAILLGAAVSGVTHQLIRLALPLPDVPAGRDEIAAIVRNGFHASLMSEPEKARALAEVDHILAASS